VTGAPVTCPHGAHPGLCEVCASFNAGAEFGGGCAPTPTFEIWVGDTKPDAEQLARALMAERRREGPRVMGPGVTVAEAQLVEAKRREAAALQHAADVRVELDEAVYQLEGARQALEKERARAQRAEEVLDELVAALPKCDECGAPATRAFRRGQGRWCDEHRERPMIGGPFPMTIVAPEYPRAAAIRRARLVRGFVTVDVGGAK